MSETMLVRPVEGLPAIRRPGRPRKYEALVEALRASPGVWHLTGLEPARRKTMQQYGLEVAVREGRLYARWPAGR